MNRSARRLLWRLGLLGPVRWARDLARAARSIPSNRRYLASGASDGLPIPPARLRILVAGHPDVGWFVESGRQAAACIRAALERNGFDIAGTLPLLDFGCGCGRVTRHFASLGAAVHGTDFNPTLVQWCRRHLTFGRFEVNGLEPPLPFDDGRFQLIYALSVFTHLPEALQLAWMAELRRVLGRGGLLMVTTHGAHYLGALTPVERERFARDELVIRQDDEPGSNFCGAYHPETYVRERLARGFEVVDFVPEGATGNPRQDLWVLRRS